MSDPGSQHPYLADPNYHRLAYHVGAQRLNWALDRQLGGPHTEYDLAEREARHAISQAGTMLRWFRAREAERPWWRLGRRRRLEARDVRLRRFLERTVVPCARLVVAGALLHNGHVEKAEKEADKVRRQAHGRQKLSYRAYYNVACYEAGRRSQEGLAPGLRALDDALHLAHGRQLREILYWAENDPALRPLHGHEMTELMRRYKLP